MRRRRLARKRVGLFGLLGQGNLGNDGSLEAVLAFLRSRHPDAALDFFCSGPDEVTRRYGHPAERLHWNRREYQSAEGPRDLMAKAIGKIVDAARTAWWVSRHEVVIVPGMGVLESTLPLRAWGFPYSLFLVCAAGRLFGTEVALVAVGADHIASASTRWMVTRAAGLATHRSYRDGLSRDAMTAMGVDTSADRLCPDLVFALPSPPAVDEPSGAGTPSTVGLGVMDYHGGNDDRAHAEELHATYVEGMIRFATWLVDHGYRIRMLTGDRSDEPVARAVVASTRRDRPDLDESSITAEPITTITDLMVALQKVDTVVATRFHNIVCATKMARPTVSLGYAAKNDVLMASMGLADYCQSVRSLDVDLLIEQFTDLQARKTDLVAAMRRQVAANAALLDTHLTAVTDTLLADNPVSLSDEKMTVRHNFS